MNSTKRLVTFKSYLNNLYCVKIKRSIHLFESEFPGSLLFCLAKDSSADFIRIWNLGLKKSSH